MFCPALGQSNETQPSSFFFYRTCFTGRDFQEDVMPVEGSTLTM